MPGFNCSNIKEIVKNYVCPDCDLILKDPIQLDCGHRICEECIKHDEELIQCKQCSEETEKKELFHDVGFKNEMKSISLRCSNCQWNGSLKDYENHLTANHINSSSNEYDQCPIIAQAQRFRKEYGKATRKWRKIISKKLNCKLVMEEQNPPVFHPQRVELCCIPTNGGLFLKIDDLKKRLTGQLDPIVTSQPFYSSEHGYEMCFRLYLSGNGNGRNTHLSIYLIVMRSEHDATLVWPFNSYVTFCLYDPTDKQKHMIKSFQLKKDFKSVQKPQSEVNIGIGFPKFIPISLIQENNNSYVCEDSIFIKVMVTKDFVSPLALSKIMNIYHALPLYLQKQMIENEVKQNNSINNLREKVELD